MALVIYCPKAFCADSETDWPEPIYFPQVQEQPVTPQASSTGGVPAGSKTDSHDEKDKKKGIWPFKKHKKESSKPTTEATNTKPGPKDPPPSPYPLLRLSMPIDSGSGIVASGIYLVKPAQEKPESTRSLVDTFMLTRQNKPVMQFKVHVKNLPDENLKLTGTPSPLSSTKPKAGLTAKAEAQLSADAKSMIIIIHQGETRMESAPFPISIDKRHILTF